MYKDLNWLHCRLFQLNLQNVITVILPTFRKQQNDPKGYSGIKFLF